MDDLSLNTDFISSKSASEISGYNADYLSRLAREKKIRGMQVGRAWVIERASLESFITSQSDRNKDLARSLALARGKEYRANVPRTKASPTTFAKPSTPSSAAMPPLMRKAGPAERAFARAFADAFRAFRVVALRGPVPAAAVALIALSLGAYGAQAAAVPRTETAAADAIALAADGARAILSGAASRAARIEGGEQHAVALASARMRARADAAPASSALAAASAAPDAIAHAEVPNVIAYANDASAPRAARADGAPSGPVALAQAASPAQPAQPDAPSATAPSLDAALATAVAFAADAAHDPFGMAALAPPAAMRAYLAFGAGIDDRIDGALAAYVSAIGRAGIALNGNQERAEAAFQAAPRAIVSGEIALGSPLIGAAHEMLQAYDGAITAYSGAAPAIPALAFGGALDAGIGTERLAVAAADAIPEGYANAAYAFVDGSHAVVDGTVALETGAGAGIADVSYGLESGAAGGGAAIGRGANAAIAYAVSAAPRVPGSAALAALAGKSAALDAAASATRGAAPEASLGARAAAAELSDSPVIAAGQQTAVFVYDLFNRGSAGIGLAFARAAQGAQLALAHTFAPLVALVSPGPPANAPSAAPPQAGIATAPPVAVAQPLAPPAGSGSAPANASASASGAAPIILNNYPSSNYYSTTTQEFALATDSPYAISFVNDVVDRVIGIINHGNSGTSGSGNSGGAGSSGGITSGDGLAITNGTFDSGAITDSTFSGSTIDSTSITDSTASLTALSLGSLNGPLDAENGVIAATTSIGAAYGGTGSTTLTGILLGNGTGPVQSLVVGSGLAFDGTTISATAGGGGSVTSVNASGGSTGLSFSGGPITGAGTLTLGGTLAVANGGTGTTTAPAFGQLLVGDGSGGYSLVATSSLGIASGATYTASYPIQLSGTDFSLAFGTTTSNTWSGLQTFANASSTDFSSVYASSTNAFFGNLAVGNLTGVLRAANGVVSAATAGTDYLAPSSLSALYPLTYNSGTGVFSTAFGTTTSNTFGGTQTFTNAPVLGALTGLIYGNNGSLAAAATTTLTASGALSFSSTPVILGSSPVSLSLGTVGVTNGGTGTTTAPAFGQILVGNGSGYTLAATVSLGLQPAGSYESPLTFDYPLTRSGNTISTAFGTTTSNTFGGTQTFTNAPVLGALTGLIYGNNGSLAAAATTTFTPSAEFTTTGALGTLLGGTNSTLSLATNGVALTKVAQIAANTILGNPTGATGNVTAIATSSLGINFANLVGAATIAQGGTGTTTAPGNGKLLIGDASGNYEFVATSSLGITSGVSSVSNSDGSLAISPTSGAVIASLNPAHSNAFTALQTFANASSTAFSSSYASSTNAFFGNLSLGGLTGVLRAASGVVSAGLVNLASDITGTLPVANGGTGSTTLTGILGGNGTGAVKTIAVGSGLSFDGTTLSSTAGGGSVTSVDASGGTTGLSFTGGPVTGSGTLTLGGTLGVANGGTGWASVASGALLYGNGGSALATTSAGTNGQVLALVDDVPTWVATTTLSTIGGALDLGTQATGTLAQADGGTGQTSYSPGDILYADGSGNLQRLPIGANGTVLKVAAGLPGWGVDLTTGSGGGGDGIFGTTTTGVVYPLDTSNPVVIGSDATSSNNSIFEVSGQSYFSSKVGIGTTSPSALLSVGGNALFSGTATVGGALNVSGTGTSTFSGPIAGTNLALGGLTNGDLVKVGAGGYLQNAVAGTDFIAPGAFDTLFDNRLSATTSLPNITTLATLSLPTSQLSGFVALGSQVSGTLPVANGGTGTTTAPAFGQLLIGNDSGGYDLTATSSLGLQPAGSYESPLTFDYPLTRSGNTISTAFGTTTSNTFGGTQTFTNAPVLGTLAGLIGANSGALYQIATSSLDANITGNAGTVTDGVYTTTFDNLFAGQLAGTTTDALAEGSGNLYFTAARATANFISNLAATTSIASITALPDLSLPLSQTTGTLPTSDLSGSIALGSQVSGTLPVANGGTGTTTGGVTDGVEYYNGTSLANDGGLTYPASGQLEIADTANSLTYMEGGTVSQEIDSDSSYPATYLERAGGTSASETAVTAGMTLGEIGFGGFGGHVTTVGAAIDGIADDDWSSSDSGTDLAFYTTPDGTVGDMAEAMRITDDGDVGIGTTTPGAAFAVNGGGLFNGNLSVAGLTATGTVAFTGLTGGLVQSSSAGVLSNIATSSLGLTTTNVAEGTNQYFTNARALAATLTGYTSGAGTVSSSDSILSAIQKLNGNIGALVTGVSSVSTGDGSLTISPTSGAVVASLNPAHANTFTALQQFNANASTTGLTSTGSAFLATAGGSVGIGTTSPAAKLAVNGSGYVTGGLGVGAIDTVAGTGEFANSVDVASSTLGYSLGGESFLVAPASISNIALGGNTEPALSGASDDIAIGDDSMTDLMSGSRNIGIGSFALSLSTAGIGNTVVGYSTDETNDGSYDTSLGYQSGIYDNGSYNIDIGQNVLAANTGDQQLDIGNLLYGTGVYGGSSPSSAAVAGGAIGIGTTTPGATFAVNGGGLFNGSVALANVTATGTASVGALDVTGTGTSTFAGNLGVTGDIIPSADDTYTLGLASTTWKSVHIGPGSLYVDGQEVVHTDEGDDVIVSASASENLQLKTTGGGALQLNPGTDNIQLEGPVSITAGKQLTTTDGSALPVPDGVAAGNLTLAANTLSATNLNGGISLSPTGSGGVYVTSGDFGIGTTSPTNKLEVNGASYLGGNADITGTATIGTLSGLLKATGGVVSAAAAGTDYLAASSLSATYPLAYDSGTGAFSTAFGTTTDNTYSGSNTFNGDAAFNGNVAIPGITDSLLETDDSGNVVAATAGVDYEPALVFSTGLNKTGSIITNTGVTSASAGSGIGVSSGSGAVTISNTGLLSLRQAGGGSAQTGAITFATSSSASTGLTSALAITNSGDAFTFAPTLSGTLDAANGGTGSTTLTGILKGNGTGALATAIGDTDYQNPITLTTSGTSGAATFSGDTLNIPNYANTTYSAGTGLTLTGTTFSVNTSQNISTLSNLTTNGLVKTSGGTGALSIATAGTDYLAPTSLSATFPLAYNSGTGAFTFGGLGTSTAAVVGNIPYFSGANTFANVATSSVAFSGAFSGASALGALVGGTGSSIDLATNGVSLGKIAQIAANTILGNPTGATGNVQAISTSSLGLLTTNVAEGSNLYFTNARAIAATLTGYASGAGTISSSDSILSAIQKLNGNIGALVTGVSSVSNSDGSLAISPTTGAVVASLNPAHANTFSALQTFANASSTAFSSVYASSTNAFFGNLAVGALSGFLGANSGAVYQIASTSLDLPNAALQNSSITVNGTGIALGASGTVTAASSTLLANNNTFSGNDTFSNLITGSISGNASTVTTDANLTGAITSSGNATSLGSFTSANLAAALTDETGSGAAVFATSPAFTTPNLGTPSAVTLTHAAGLPLSTGVTGTLAVANGGTGSTTLSGILIGNGTSAVNTLTVGTGLTLSGTTLTASASGTVGSGTTGQFPYYASSGTTLTATSSIFLATSGKVGVGTTSPAAPFSVGGNSYFAGNVGIGIANPTDALDVTGNVHVIGGGSGNITLDTNGFIGNSSTNAIQFSGTGINFVGSNGTEAIFDPTAPAGSLKLTSAGNFGIGTTTPGALFSVQGNGLFSGTLATANIVATGTAAISGTATVGNLINSGLTANTLIYANGSKQETSVSAGTAGNILALLNGIPTWTATTTAGTGLTLTGGAFNVNTSQNISTLSNLTSNGLVKTSGGTGALSIAVAGTDYAPATSGSGLLYGNGSGGFSTASFSGGLSFSGGTLTLGTAGVLGIANGGTATSTGGVTNGVEYFNGTTLTNGSGFIFNGTNVGIGTTSPTTNFSVVGNGYFDNALDVGYVGANTAGNLYVLGTAVANRYDGGGQDGGIDTVSTPSFYWNGDANTGMYHPSAGAVEFSNNGTQSLVLNSSGNGVFENNMTVVGNATLEGTVAFTTLANSRGTDEVCVTTPGTTGVISYTTNATGCTSNSDERLKTDITPLGANNGLAAVMQLNPVSFYWKDPSLEGGDMSEQYGLIAQQVLPILPQDVATSSPTYLTPDQTYDIAYQGFIPIALNAIKELGEGYSLANPGTGATSTIASSYQGTAAAAITVGTTGNVGVGTGAPAARLQIAGNVLATEYDVSAAGLATAYTFPTTAQTASSTLSATLPSSVLTASSTVNLYALATYNLSGITVLASRIQSDEMRLDSLESQVAALEAGAYQASSTGSGSGSGSSGGSSGPIAVATSTIVNALHDVGIFIMDGIAQFQTLAADRFVAATDSAGNSSAGNGVILAGNTTTLVTNAYVNPDSKIFVTFTATTTSSWYIADKEQGSFRITLTAPQGTDATFDYFVVETDGQIATTTFDGASLGGDGSSTDGTPDSGTASTSPGGSDASSTASTSPDGAGGSDASSTPSDAGSAGSTAPDMPPPQVRLIGSAAMQIGLGTAWQDPGATAADGEGADISGSIVVTGSVDNETPGTYTITYTATDSEGQEASASRVVVVGAPQTDAGSDSGNSGSGDSGSGSDAGTGGTDGTNGGSDASSTDPGTGAGTDAGGAGGAATSTPSGG